MPDEVVTAPVGGAGGGGEAGGGSSMPPASMSDTEFLNQPDASTDAGATAAGPPAGSETKPPQPTTEEINLSALEEGQPEWLAKVTDPAVKSEVEKLLSERKAFSERFKDAADLEEFFKDLPGGREQVAALQTLSKEVGELDSALEANQPEGLTTVAERYLSMTPDGGVNLMRAAAQHMAKANPEAWNQISHELINSTLKASGIGADLQGIVSGIAEMRAAAEAQNWEAFGQAAAKIMGAPKAEPKQDPNLARLTERESAARTSEQKALSENWTHKRDSSAAKITTHMRTEAGKALSKVLPSSINDKDREKLLNDIQVEIESQVYSNAWMMSQIRSLIGRREQDGKGGYTFSKALLNADQKAFDQSAELVIKAANSKLITAAVAKVVTEWSKGRAATNLEARNKARGAAARVEPGSSKVPAARKTITAESLRERNEDGTHKISDRDFLNL